MANPEHLAILATGADRWNSWRRSNPNTIPDLVNMRDYRDEDSWEVQSNVYFRPLNSARYEMDRTNILRIVYDKEKIDLDGAQLCGASLRGSDLRNTRMRAANLKEADLTDAVLIGVDLRECLMVDARLTNATFAKADLSGAALDRVSAFRCNFEEAVLCGTGLIGAQLRSTSFCRAALQGAELQGANISDANFENANLTGSSVYGVSVWNTKLDGAIQSSLLISRADEPVLEVDSIEVAQFVHLLLNNRSLRGVIDSITSKVVLILGRFTPERKEVLEGLRIQLRRSNYLPILFDFDKPKSRDITETVSTLAHLARFIIADITDAKSIPQELMSIVPALPSVPVQPLLLASQQEYGMFEHFQRYPWVLKPFLYENAKSLLDSLAINVIAPAEARAKERISGG